MCFLCLFQSVLFGGICFCLFLECLIVSLMAFVLPSLPYGSSIFLPPPLLNVTSLSSAQAAKNLKEN